MDFVHYLSPFDRVGGQGRVLGEWEWEWATSPWSADGICGAQSVRLHGQRPWCRRGQESTKVLCAAGEVTNKVCARDKKKRRLATTGLEPAPLSGTEPYSAALTARPRHLVVSCIAPGVVRHQYDSEGAVL
eukprot:scaffold394_cov112-Isochrysis_galbana.AAC.1